MKKSIGKNYIYNLIYEILTVLVPLITTPYISRVLGADGIGIYSYTNSIVTYFALVAALGTTVYARRECAYYQDNKEKRSIVFWEILSFRTIMTVLCMAVYMIYVWFSDYHTIAIIQSLYVIAVAFDITWFFQGMEDFGTVVLRNSIVKIVNIAVIFIFVKNADDLNIYIFALAFLPLVANVVTWACISKYVKKIPIKKMHPARHFKGALALFIPTIASQVYLVLDKTMIGVLVPGNTENGYYEQAQKIIRICWTFVTTFGAVMSPRIAYIFANKASQQLRAYMRSSFRVVWFLAAPIAFGMASIATNVVPWFFGTGFEKVAVLLFIFAWIVFPVGINSVTGSQYLVATKKQTPYTFSIIAGACVNILMNAFLITRFYSVGAAIASVTAECIISAIQIVYVTVVIREIKFNDIFGPAWHYLLAGVIMFVSVKAISGLLAPEWISTVILICTGAIIYLLILAILRDELIKMGISKIKHILKRNA